MACLQGSLPPQVCPDYGSSINCQIYIPLVKFARLLQCLMFLHNLCSTRAVVQLLVDHVQDMDFTGNLALYVIASHD